MNCSRADSRVNCFYTIDTAISPRRVHANKWSINRKFPTFIEPEIILPCLHKSAGNPYTEPDEFKPHHTYSHVRVYVYFYMYIRMYVRIK
jgi:hypothetical protein